MEYLQFMFSSFWHFVGCYFLIALVLTAILALPFKIINRYLRHRNIIKRGWPPPHLDADGDFDEKRQP